MEDQGRNGQMKMNKKLSGLVARNVILTHDSEIEEQVNVALTGRTGKTQASALHRKVKEGIKFVKRSCWRRGKYQNESLTFYTFANKLMK